ncbi:MAG: hypothetical protein UMU76_08525 [Prosthecochloris sp.]|nr:hypothetical protein [Prosthecochloris sp.]
MMERSCSVPGISERIEESAVLETVVDGVAVIARVVRMPWRVEVHLLEPYQVWGYDDIRSTEPVSSCDARDDRFMTELVRKVYCSYRDLLRALPELRSSYRLIEDDLMSARSRFRELERLHPVEKKKVKAMLAGGGISAEGYQRFIAALREQKLQALNRVLALEHAFLQTAACRFRYFAAEDIFSLIESPS